MPIFTQNDVINAALFKGVIVNRRSTILQHPEDFNNGDLILCRENKSIYLKLNDIIEQYGNSGNCYVVPVQKDEETGYYYVSPIDE